MIFVQGRFLEEIAEMKGLYAMVAAVVLRWVRWTEVLRLVDEFGARVVGLMVLEVEEMRHLEKLEQRIEGVNRLGHLLSSDRGKSCELFHCGHWWFEDGQEVYKFLSERVSEQLKRECWEEIERESISLSKPP